MTTPRDSFCLFAWNYGELANSLLTLSERSESGFQPRTLWTRVKWSNNPTIRFFYPTNISYFLTLLTSLSNYIYLGPSVDDIIVKDEAEIEHSKTYVAEAELKRKSPDRDDNEAVSKWPCSDDSDISASDLSMEDMEKVRLLRSPLKIRINQSEVRLLVMWHSKSWYFCVKSKLTLMGVHSSIHCKRGADMNRRPRLNYYGYFPKLLPIHSSRWYCSSALNEWFLFPF